jgi:succinoglycan biosynthesis protein ExoM
MATLQSLAEQDFGCDRFRVIIADNAAASTIRAQVEQSGVELGLTVLYVHAPERNISVARNACLDQATSPMIAFLDDDEVASPQWLSSLVARRDTTGADVVFGPVQAEYSQTAPEWMRRARFHDIKPTFLAGDRVENGYTSNVLIRSGCLVGQRFLLALGRTGGEDTVFFHELARSGVKMVYADNALVSEPVPEPRERLQWMLSRAFRSGQSHGRTLRSMPGGASFGARSWNIAVAALKCLFLVVTALASLWNSARWRRSLIRASLHAGVVSFLVGTSEIELY